MRRYTLRINDTEHVLDVEEVGSDSFTVQLSGGRLVDVTLVDHQDLGQALITPGVVVGQVRGIEEGNGSAATGARTTPVAPRPARPAPVRPRDGDQTLVTAPMPGVVLAVDVAVGQAVTRGQTLIVLEAMKMKNDLKAQRDGVIARVQVAAGDQVKHGDPLVEFEG